MRSAALPAYYIGQCSDHNGTADAQRTYHHSYNDHNFGAQTAKTANNTTMGDLTDKFRKAHLFSASHEFLSYTENCLTNRQVFHFAL
jgi:hypothetical protein